MRPGLYASIPEDVYRADPAVSKSDLWTFRRSPAHWADQDRKDTPAMRFGRAYHSAVLTPSLFEWDYVTMPPGLTLRSNAGKEWARDAEATGKQIIQADEMATIQDMRDALFSDPMAAGLIGMDDDSETELSIFWDDPEYHTPCKARVDILAKTITAVIDLKTTTDARPEAFEKAAWSLGYHVQAAWYTYGLRQITKEDHAFYFVAQETARPYGVVVFRAGQAMIDEGMKEAYRILADWVECAKTGNYPGYRYGIVELNPPGWVTRKNNQPIFE